MDSLISTTGGLGSVWKHARGSTLGSGPGGGPGGGVGGGSGGGEGSGVGSSFPPPKIPTVAPAAAPAPMRTAVRAPLPAPCVAPVELMNRSIPVARKPGGTAEAPALVLPTTTGGAPSSLSSHSSGAVTNVTYSAVRAVLKERSTASM